MQILSVVHLPFEGGGQLNFQIMGMSHYELENYSGDKMKIDLPPSQSQRIIAFVGNYKGRIYIEDVCEFFSKNMLIGFQINEMIYDSPYDWGKDEKWVILT